MYAWETLNIYCQQDDRWFEPVSRHVPDAAYLAVYRALMPDTWRLRRRGLWFIADPPMMSMPGEGWKLHVSVRTSEATAALRAAIPVLRDRGTHFKFLVDPWALASTNGKLWPRGSSGKFITAYPHDTDEFRAVARELTAALTGFTGPFILSDRRCPDSTAVYYRYGGFVGQPQLRPDGGSDLMMTAPDGSRYPDIRHPYWSAPPWITTDPFGLPAHEDVQPSGGDTGQLGGGRFAVESAIAFTNRGGVYRGVDRTTGLPVVIKEARPHVGLGAGSGADFDTTDLLDKEHQILTGLADVEQFVTPLALFREWEHLFLAEEYVEGKHLGHVSIGSNPIYTTQFTRERFAAYHGRMRNLFAQLADAIAAAHRRGIVLADLSFTNVLVDAADQIRIIDVEGAVREGVDEATGLYTPGISGHAGDDSRVSPRDDYAALGAMIFGSIMLGNAMVGFDPAALPRMLAELRRDLGLPEDLVSLVRCLTAEDSPGPAEPELLAKQIAELSVAEPGAWPQVLPLARPAAEQIVGERAEQLRTRIANTVDGVVRHIERTATPLRDDRLFPADLGVFETNPLSVGFGATGVLRALHRLSGKVPSDLLAWVLRQDIALDELPSGLYFGQAGIAWALDELGQSERAVELLRTTAKHPLLFERADVLHGCAGYGLAALRLWQTTGGQGFLDEAVRVGERLSATARRTADGASWVGTNGRVPIGYGYGASGIALFLLYLHCATGDDATARLGRQALDFDLAHAQTTDVGVTAFLSHTEDKTGVLRGYWDYGTAGVVTTLVRYLAVTGDPQLVSWLERLLPDITRKYAVLPQMFHGLSGIGNTMLDVAEFTGRTDLLAEAMRTAEGVLLFATERAEGIAFPGEQALRETCDFASGSAGVALFLNRVLTAGPGRRTNFNFVLDDLIR